MLTSLRLGTGLLLLALLSCGATGSATHQAEAPPLRLDPGLALVDIDGAPVGIAADLEAGRPLVLVFWQTWCRPCREEAPALANAARRYEGRLRFVGIVPGTDEFVDVAKVRDTATKWGLPYVQVRDADLHLSETLDVEGTPTIVVVSTSGEVLFKAHHPPEDWESFLP